MIAQPGGWRGVMADGLCYACARRQATAGVLALNPILSGLAIKP